MSPDHPQRSRRALYLRRTFVLAALVFIARTFIADFDQLRSLEPNLAWLVPAAVLAFAGWVASAAGWLVLFDAKAPRRPLLHAYAVGQLGKYAPGNVMQAVGQVGFAKKSGLAASDVSVAFVVSIATSIEGGLLVGSTALISDSAIGWLRSIPAAAAVGLLLLRPTSISRMLRLLPARIRPVTIQIPSYRRILASALFAGISLVSSGFAFVAVGASLTTALPLSSVTSYAVSWVFGVLAVPVPAGIGVREAVLGELLVDVPFAVVVSISLVHRFVTMTTEAALALLTSRLDVAAGGLTAAEQNPDQNRADL